MTEIPAIPPPVPVKRPVLVWVISIFYVVSAGWTLLSFALILSGLIPLPAPQKNYFSSLGFVDWATTLLILFSNFSGAILLFFLKRIAPYCFTVAFVVAIVQVIYQIVAKHWLDAVGIPGLIGAVIGWAINIAIIAYTWLLARKGVLR